MKSSSTNEISAIDKKHVIHPTTNPYLHAKQGPKAVFAKGSGVNVIDAEGRSFMDGVSMLWNVNTGHGQKELAAAAYEQMAEIAYGSQFYGFTNKPAAQLAEKLAALAPGSLDSVFFTSGGSESNDTAFKLARFYWQQHGYSQKNKIISLQRGYHGVTVSAQRATGIDAFRNFSGSKDPDILNAKAHLTECELGDRSHPDYKGCIRSIIEKEGADRVAAVILEPVQGAGGVHLPPEGYVEAVRALCDEHNVLMIADEVICGFGRTGEMFGMNHWNVTPDLMCIAKGITSGYAQLGGVLISEKVNKVIVQYDNVLAHGFTYSGHPTACAVGLKNIEIIERDGLVARAKEMGDELKKGLQYLQDKHRCVAKPRNLGLLAGFDLMKDPEASLPFHDSVKAANTLVEECFDRNLIIRPFDFEEGMNIVAIAPPLVITKQEMENMITIIDEALTAVSSKWE
nr:aspartate aminotransferase family protein [Alteribacillus bidgolensis]